MNCFLDFVTANWLWLGGANLALFVVVILNFLAGAKSSMRMDIDGFARSVKRHIIFILLFVIAFIPFFIGAVINIVHYIQHHG